MGLPVGAALWDGRRDDGATGHPIPGSPRFRGSNTEPVMSGNDRCRTVSGQGHNTSTSPPLDHQRVAVTRQALRALRCPPARVAAGASTNRPKFAAGWPGRTGWGLVQPLVRKRVCAPRNTVRGCLCRTAVHGRMPCVLPPAEACPPRPARLFRRRLPGKWTLRRTGTPHRGAGIRRRRPAGKRIDPRQPRRLVRVDQSLPSGAAGPRGRRGPPEHTVSHLPAMPA